MSNHVDEEKRPIYKKWWFWLIIIIVIIGIAGAGSNNNTNTVTATPSTSSSTENNSTQNEKTIVSVGEEVSTNNTKITFVSAKDYTSYNSYSAPKTGNKIVRAEFTFENISNSDVYLNNLECYADGEKCDEYYYADDYKSPTLESLSSGKRVKVIVYYEVPTNAENIILEYETSAWTSNKIEFKIK